jgi:glycosyltransferase involved in cell wall biosynthesis
VDAYIALSEFARAKFIEGGLPAERVFVKPNFVAPDPGAGAGKGGFALFAGRLSPEKGVETLLRAWDRLGDIPLRILGSGPLAPKVARRGVTPMGQVPREAVLDTLRRAAVLILPSEWYEGSPLILLEAFACGTPVIASRLGALAECIRDGETGLLFRPGDADELAAKVRYAFSQPEHLARMRLNARREYEALYTAERNYQMLMSIYEHATENARRRRRRASRGNPT